LFQEKGWNVVATMRTPEKEEELTKHNDVLVTRLDVQDSQSIQEAVKQGIEKFGRIDVLLNNAGYGAFGVLEAFSMDRVRRQFDVNVIGLIEVTQAILPHFRANGNGMVINITSMGGKMPFPMGSLYHATKYAVEGFSDALFFELEAIGCKMKIVEPGHVKTDFSGRSMDLANDESLTEYQEMIGKFITAWMSSAELGGSSEPSMVAEVIFEAATDGTDQLRYIAGDDAKAILENRKKMDDREFIAAIRPMFGL
jgi:short-subunit dehydrogenase